MSNALKKRLDWTLDKLNDIALGAYGLQTGGKWLKTAEGNLSIPDAAILVATTLLLFVAWAIIGALKGYLEGQDNDSN